MADNLLAASIELTLRPLKFGFLVNPNDEKQMRRAIETATFLWGGAASPFLPQYEQVPENYFHSSAVMSEEKFFEGYLNAFDPDYLVGFGTGHQWDHKLRRLFDIADLWKPVESYGALEHGAGLFEILDYWTDNEFKYVRKDPIRVCIPNASEKYSLFFAAVFGGLPVEVVDTLMARYSSKLEIEKKNFEIADFVDLYNHDTFFLRRISSLYTSRPDRDNRTAIMLLDATSPADIFDYWNFRATGWLVLPVPIQAYESSKVIEFCKKFVSESSRPTRFNWATQIPVSLLGSRSIERNDVEKLYSSVRDEHSRLMLQHWYPRIWDDWARPKDRVEAEPLACKSTTRRTYSSRTTFVFSPLQPEFNLLNFNTKYANEISMRIEGSDELLAEVMPEGGQRLASTIDYFGMGEWRFSKRGLVLLGGRHEDVRVKVPLAREVFEQWFTERGWEVKVSDAGLTTEAMMRQLGGIYGLNLLANYSLIELLIKVVEPSRELAGVRSQLRGLSPISKEFPTKIDELYAKLSDMESKFGYEPGVIEYDALMKDLNKIAKGYSRIRTDKQLLKQLVDTKLFQVGVNAKCKKCTQSTWLDRASIGQPSVCPICGNILDVMADNPREIPWAYKAFGPFQTPGAAHGSYSVLLTLRFLSHFLHSASSTTPILSFCGKKKEGDEEPIEADLGLFVRYSFIKEETKLVFAECKTSSYFKQVDIDRIKKLISDFPEAVGCFATLKENLNQEEKALIKCLIETLKPRNDDIIEYKPILILTRNELATEDIFDLRNRLGLSHESLDALCDATQKAYL